MIDQFRADTIGRFRSQFQADGFRYLLDHGAYYPFGEYDILQCMTAPGHSTILSGARPYLSGIPVNNSFDAHTLTRRYLAEDPAHLLVGAEKQNPRAGSSPALFAGTTLGDEMKNSGYASRVVSVSLKDRSAILLGGHRADLAIWHDAELPRWISSAFYLPDGKLPAWVEKLNAELGSKAGKSWDWTPKGTGELSWKDDALLSPKRMWGMPKDFPKKIDLGSKFALSTPYGVQITADAAIAALDAYKLGKGKHTDLLAVSISSHDYVVHEFGPNSREAESITLAEDEAIARIIAHVKKTVGLNQAVFVLTADHGGLNVPEYLAQNRVPTGRIDEDELQKLGEDAIAKAVGKPKGGKRWIPSVVDFNFFLDREALLADGSYGKALAALKELLLTQAGTQFVVTREEYDRQLLPPGAVGERVLHTYYPGRSGDVILIPKPQWVQKEDSATHLTGYAYDRYVPILFAGAPFKPGRYAQGAKVIDIAPTLAFLLGVTPPSLNEGRVLHEALKP